MEAGRRCFVLAGLDGLEVVALEVGLGAKEARVPELHDRPEVADVALHRGASEGDAAVGLGGSVRRGPAGRPGS